MHREAIFGPVGVLALWTIAVLFMTGTRRVVGTLTGRIPRGAFELGESPDVPTDVVVLNRNLMNLLEMPVLFYVASVACYVTGQVRPLVLGLAWLYVLLRIAHSFVHLTSNHVIARLVTFALSNVVLFALWIWLLVKVAF